MRRPPILLFSLFLAGFINANSAEKRAIFPAGVKPIGPYSPGILVGEYLYVSGQGARGPDRQMPPTFEAQLRQCLENIKSVVEAAGLTPCGASSFQKPRPRAPSWESTGCRMTRRLRSARWPFVIVRERR